MLEMMMTMTVLISTCPTVWCVVTPCGYNSTLENGADTTAVVLSYLPYMLNSAAYILLSYLATCPLLYALLHSKALNAGTLHCMALQLQRQLLYCTMCTFHYMADQRRLHRGEGTSLRR